MKNTYLLLTLLITGYTNAQITLTSADFATAGDTVRVSQAMDPALDYSSTGPNYSWDFSTLTANSQVLKQFHNTNEANMLVQLMLGTFAPTAYKASYFIESTALPIDQITSFLPVTINNVYQFVKVGADSVTAVGYSMEVNTQQLPFRSDTIEKIYDLPVVFGNTHQSRGYTNIDLSAFVNAQWIQHRSRYTVVDGYGSLTTPYGTYNVLRIKHDIVEQDSIFFDPGFGGFWLPITLNSSEYEWWTNGQKLPLLKVITNTVFGNETITSIEYRDHYLGLDAGLEEAQLSFQLYPNPVGNELYLRAQSGVDEVRILDVNGRIVMTERGSGAELLQLNTSSLEAGAYVVEVRSSVSAGRTSFVKY